MIVDCGEPESEALGDVCNLRKQAESMGSGPPIVITLMTEYAKQLCPNHTITHKPK